MKNKLTYYLAITIPPLALVLLSKMEVIGSTWFVVLLLTYILVYRTYTDGKRLAVKGIIKESDIWKMVIPGHRYRYFKELYLR